MITNMILNSYLINKGAVAEDFGPTGSFMEIYRTVTGTFGVFIPRYKHAIERSLISKIIDWTVFMKGTVDKKADELYKLAKEEINRK